MKFVRTFGSILLTTIAALAGNWAGEELRFRVTGEQGRRFRFTQESSQQGETLVAINPALSNLFPALVVGALRKPHSVWAFLSGLLFSALVGDEFEEEFLDWLKTWPK